MIRSIFILLITTYCTYLQAANSNQLLQNLTAVNAEWPKQPECIQVVETANVGSPQNYTQWITTHLRLVEQTLRNRDVSYLNSEQKNNRTHLLNELHGYWQAGVFPQNTYINYKTPVFIDAIGTHCAVGYLMQQSGSDDLAQRINRNEKLAYVHQIKTDGVIQWADKNGFTADELAWIQPGYPPTNIIQSMDSGVNATVNTIAVDTVGQIVYIGGNFTQTSSGVTTNHIAAWISGFAGYSWISVGNGVNGNVHTLLLQNNKLYAGGEFTMAGSMAVSHVAVYDIALGQWQALGTGLDSTVHTLAFYNNELYAGGDFSGGFSKWNGTTWEDKSGGIILGSVKTLEVWNNQLAIGGNFDVATGAPRKNVMRYDGAGLSAFGVGGPTPVNDFAVWNGRLYAACDAVQGVDTCALAYYDTSAYVWKVVLKQDDGLGGGFGGNAIKSITPFGSQLIASGDFYCGSGLTYGNNLMLFSQTTYPNDTILYNVCNPLISTDSTVNAIAVSNNQLYFGGEFLKSYGNISTDNLNHIAYLQLQPNGVETPANEKVSLNLFPNPASNIISLTTNGDADIQRIEIFDIMGKTVLSQNVTGSTVQLPINEFAAGIYTVEALTNNGWSTAKLVKQ